MPRELVTRSDLRRALAVNAVTRPVNVAVPAAVVVAAILLDAGWLVAIAVLCFVALAVLTFLDEGEAERVGARIYARRRGAVAAAAPAPAPADEPELAPDIADRIDAARAAQADIERAIAEGDLPADDIRDEVAELLTTLMPIAVRADRVADYLAGHPPRDVQARIAALRERPAAGDSSRARTVAALEDQLRAIRRLEGQHAGLLDEMDHVVASLEALHAEVVTLGAAGDDWRRADVAGQVRALREGVQVLSGGMEEAYAETRSAGARAT
jgi:hypothetical protein